MPSSNPITPDAITVPLHRSSQAGPAEQTVPLQSANPGAPGGKAASSSAPEVEEAPCPRCGAKLINPGSLGWCMKCGYCKSLVEEGAKVLPAEQRRRPSLFGIVEALELLTHVPAWIWTLLAGMVLVAGISFAAHVVLPRNSLPRALWSTIVIGVSVLTVFVAQIWLMIELAPKDEENRLTPWQLLWIFPARLWKHAFKHLPETRRQISLGAWAWVGIKCSVLIVGGLDFWFQYYQPKKIAGRGLQDAVAAAQAAADGTKSLEDSVQDFAGKGSDILKAKLEDKTDKRPVIECVVIGYTMDQDEGTLTGLIIATMKDDTLSYAGIVRRGFTPQATEEMMTRFAKLVRPSPFVRGLRVPDAIWLKPEVYCEVHQSGWGTDGLLIQPNFKALLKAQR